MALNITSSGAQAVADGSDAILIQVNGALTGTIAVTAAGSTQYGTSSSTIGTITNPTVGLQFRYYGLRTQGKISVNPSAGCDITVSLISNGV